jgi:hypothetical protein
LFSFLFLAASWVSLSILANSATNICFGSADMMFCQRRTSRLNLYLWWSIRCYIVILGQQLDQYQILMWMNDRKPEGSLHNLAR